MVLYGPAIRAMAAILLALHPRLSFLVPHAYILAPRAASSLAARHVLEANSLFALKASSVVRGPTMIGDTEVGLTEVGSHYINDHIYQGCHHAHVW